MKTLAYDCSRCPGYCCSYPVIQLNGRDIRRLAKHFGLAFEAAERKFTHAAHGHERVMRRKPDVHFGKVCRFFDRDERRCTVYPARPEVCRRFPAQRRCGYYEFLRFERAQQGDPEFVATTENDLWD